MRVLQTWATKFSSLVHIHIIIETWAPVRELAQQGSQVTATCSTAVSPSTMNCDSAHQSICFSPNGEVPFRNMASHSHLWDYIDQLESS